jgi:hypothetical protein
VSWIRCGKGQDKFYKSNSYFITQYTGQPKSKKMFKQKIQGVLIKFVQITKYVEEWKKKVILKLFCNNLKKFINNLTNLFV